MITASPAHATAFAAIHAAAFPPAEAWDAAAFATLLASPSVHGLIDGSGGLILIRRAADEAEILTLATIPQARRAGIARGLLMAALGWAASAGTAQVFLEVSDANTAAQALYCSAGFTICGRRPRYYADGSDALVLRFTAGG